MNRGMFGFPRKYNDPALRDRRAPDLFIATDYGAGGCVQWVKSRDLVDTLADPRSTNVISAWTDRSSGGNDFSTSGATVDISNPPFWLPRAWNGFGAVRFHNSRMTSGCKPATGASSRTVLLVHSHVTYPNADTVFYQYGAGGTLTLYGLRTTAASLTYRADYSSTLTNGTGAATTGKPDVVVHVFDGTTDRIYLNGASIYTATPALNTGSTYGIALGGAVGTNPGGPYGHYNLFEFAAWNTNLSSGDITALTSVLQAQYECA